MGVCLSCLGLTSNTAAENEPSETSRLLNPGASQSQYNSSTGPAAYHDPVDPELERRERDSLGSMWKLTSDKLIDVSSTNTTASEYTATRAPEVDFARLFRETFPRQHQPQQRHHQRRSRSKLKRLNSQGDGVSSEQDQGLPSPSQSYSPSDEQTWLRNIILRNPEDKTWDCNSVYKTGKPLVIEFEEVGKKNEGVAVKALKDAQDKLR